MSSSPNDGTITGLIGGLQYTLAQLPAVEARLAPSAAPTAQRPMPTPPFSVIYAFGDSFSANTGQYSNGPVWVQDLASTLGLSGVTDFAEGGAQTGVTALHPTANNTDLPNQLAWFNETVPAPQANALYTVWAGANDVQAIESTPGMTTNLALVDIGQAVTNEVNFVSELAQQGAQNVMVLNVPDQAAFPAFASQGPMPAYETSLLTQIYNDELSANMRGLAASDGIKLDLVDTYTLFDQMVANPAAYGFTDVTDPVQYSNAPNPNQYLFYDADHPSAAGHAQIAALAAHTLGITA